MLLVCDVLYRLTLLIYIGGFTIDIDETDSISLSQMTQSGVYGFLALTMRVKLFR